jgi:hypothetical protein
MPLNMGWWSESGSGQLAVCSMQYAISSRCEEKLHGEIVNQTNQEVIKISLLEFGRGISQTSL